MTWTSAPLHRLARLVLAWYVLFVGISVLASTLQPKTLEVVCSSMGIMKLVVQGEEGETQVRSSMDCPLCAHATPALPPPTLANLAHVPDARAYIVQRLPEALLLARTAPPLPSRGPPVFNGSISQRVEHRWVFGACPCLWPERPMGSDRLKTCHEKFPVTFSFVFGRVQPLGPLERNRSGTNANRFGHHRGLRLAL